MGRGIGYPLTRPGFRWVSGGGPSYTYSPAESAALLPQTAVWVSTQGVTVATGVSAWASYLGGLACTISQATGGLQPAYSAAGGVGGRPLITANGTDQFLRGTMGLKGSAYTTNEMGLVGQRVAWAAGTDFIIGYEAALAIQSGIRDGATAATWRGTDIALYDLASTSDPDGVNAFYSFNGSASLGQVRKNGTVEASNATTPTSMADGGTFVFGGRTITAAYANWSVQALVFGVQLDNAQRDYLRAALTFHTGITC